MRFLIFGAGALGSLFGGLLSRRHGVVLVARRAHVEAIKRRGLRITGHTEMVARPEAVESVRPSEDADVVILTVKAYDTERAVEALRPLWDSATFLSLQNGLGNEDVLAARVGRVLGGVTSQGVTFLGPGEILHAGVGETYVGPFKGVDMEDAKRVALALEESGIPCSAVEDIRMELWIKAIINAAINPLTALLRVKNGYLTDSPSLREVVIDVVSEGVRVANAHGIKLGYEEILERVWTVVRSTADNKSSMLQDVERGRKTEIEAINGAIRRMGRSAGVPTPVNSVLASLVKAVEGADATIHEAS